MTATGLDFHRGGEGKSRRCCPHAKTSGGLSNLSFSFRGNETVRRAMAFGCSCTTRSPPGSTWRFVNAGQLTFYDQIGRDLVVRLA